MVNVANGRLDMTLNVDSGRYVRVAAPVHEGNTGSSLSTSAEDHDVMQSASTVANMWHGLELSEASGYRSQMKSSENLFETLTVDSHSFSSDDMMRTTDPLHRHGTGKMSPEDSKDLSPLYIELDFLVTSESVPLTTDGPLSSSSTRMVDSASVSKHNITSHLLQADTDSEGHSSDIADKTADNSAAVTWDAGNVSMARVPTSGINLSETSATVISTMLNNHSHEHVTSQVQDVHHRQTVKVANRPQSSSFQFTAGHETATSASSSKFPYVGDYANEVNPAGNLLVNGTAIGVPEGPVGIAGAVSITTAISLSVSTMLGICAILLVAFGIIIVIRNYRKPRSIETSSFSVQNEKHLLPEKTYSGGLDYAEVKRQPSRTGSINRPDEVFLLPREQAVHSASVDSSLSLADGDSMLDELDQLVRVDVDMSSLLQLVQNSHDQSAAPVGTLGCSESFRQNAASVSDSQSDSAISVAASENARLPAEPRGQFTGTSSRPSFHEYDPVYVPHHDAAAMARRVDSETSYVRTLQPRQHGFSPYEEVFYGISPVLLPERPPVQVHQLPVAPPRTSSIDQSCLRNSANNRVIRECRNASQAAAADHSGELSYQANAVSRMDAGDSPYETIVINNRT